MTSPQRDLLGIQHLLNSSEASLHQLTALLDCRGLNKVCTQLPNWHHSSTTRSTGEWAATHDFRKQLRVELGTEQSKTQQKEFWYLTRWASLCCVFLVTCEFPALSDLYSVACECGAVYMNNVRDMNEVYVLLETTHTSALSAFSSLPHFACCDFRHGS